MDNLIKSKGRLNIAVVGANDGKINDPIYRFVKQNVDSTQVLLIEPFKPVVPFLEENYSFHPSHKIANCAIGAAGVLTLYSIKPEYWEKFQPGYAKDWPTYRAASGITSAIRSHLEKCLVRQKLDPEATIESHKIASKELKTVLQELDWPMPLDVLQVDAEGFDDVVIYHANIDLTQPKLIYFESHNMVDDKSHPLVAYLHDHGYQLFQAKGNCLAIKKSLSFWYFKTVFSMRVRNR